MRNRELTRVRLDGVINSVLFRARYYHLGLGSCVQYRHLKETAADWKWAEITKIKVIRIDKPPELEMRRVSESYVAGPR